jgi:hypothetical protein
MDHHAIAQRGSGIENGARIDAAVVADAHALADDRSGLDARSLADAGALADHRAGANADAFAQLHIRANRSGGMHSGGRRRRLEQLARPCKPQSRLLRLHNALPFRIRFSQPGPQKNHTRTARQRLGGRRCVLGKNQFRSRGQSGRVHAVDHKIRTPLRQFSVQNLNQFTQLHRVSPLQS